MYIQLVLPAPATGVNTTAVETLRRFGGPGAKKKGPGLTLYKSIDRYR